MENFLIQHVTEITRVRNTEHGSMLDLVFSKDEEFIIQIEFGPHLGKSDQLLMKIKVKDLKVDKAMGPDGLCPRILHETREQVADPIKMLFDKILTQRQLPSDWKDAIVVPIFKKRRRDMACKSYMCDL